MMHIYKAQQHEKIYGPLEAIEIALDCRSRGDIEEMRAYATLALALTHHQGRHRTIPASGWVLLEHESDDLIIASHVVAFHETDNADGGDPPDLRPMVWMPGDGAACTPTDPCQLVRAEDFCGDRSTGRAFGLIVERGDMTAHERAWIRARYPVLNPKGATTP